jgi:hypothetical protein
MSMKKFNDTTENRTCDVPTCNAVAQPTANSLLGGVKEGGNDPCVI